jgi:hypothetical protein
MDIQSKFPDLDPKDAIDSPTEVQRKEEKAAARRQYGIDYKRRQRKLKKLQKTMSESNAFLTPSKAPTLSSQNAKADMEEWKLLVASAQHGP